MITLGKLPETFFAAYGNDFEIGGDLLHVGVMHTGEIPVVGQRPLPKEWYYFRAICGQYIQTGVIEWDQENGPLTYKVATMVVAALWNGEKLAVVNDTYEA